SGRKFPLDRFVMRKFARSSGQKRQKNERDVHQKEKRPSRVVDPFARTQPANRNQQHCPDQKGVEKTDKSSITRHPLSGRTNRVVKIGGNDQSRARHHRDPEQPKVPCDDEASEFVEAELRPLIKTSFERENPIQKNNHRGEWEIKKENGE